MTLVVLGTVDTPYWEHNPGSREQLPKANPWLAPTLSADEAAEAIFAGVERRKRTVVKPAIFRALFLLNALVPASSRVSSGALRATHRPTVPERLNSQ